MFRKTQRLFLVATSFVVLTGCAAISSSAPVQGGLYTNVKTPVTATSYSSYSKVGTASCVSILGIVGYGDASIEAAIEDGQISFIHHVDSQSINYLGLYTKYTVYVYGD